MSIVNKRGQVTIFIILGMLIVGIGAGFYFFKDAKSDKVPESSEFVNLERNFVDCVEKVCNDAVMVIGMTGGYYIPPENSNSLGIAYYYYSSGKVTIPSKKSIEKELKGYIDEAVPLCKNALNVDNKTEVMIPVSQSEVKIFSDHIAITGEFPLYVTRGTEEFSVKKIGRIDIKNRLGEMYNLAVEIVENLSRMNGRVCISCMNNIREEGFALSVRSQNDSQIYTLMDMENQIKTGLEERPYTLMFAVKND